jgi:hypothetical protein
MARKVWAFVAFNVYSLFLLSAFQENTAYLFDSKLINEMRLTGIEIDPREWGWGNHYIWRLFAGVLVTAVAAFLCGAIAKTNSARTAAIANIPSILVWGAMIYLFGFSGVEAEGRTGYIAVSVIAIPLTTALAYFLGRMGEEVQKQEYEEGTVLGVKAYHWIWAIIPLYWYSLGIVFVITKFLSYQLWADASIFATIISGLLLLPVIAWIYPWRLVHRVLSGELLRSYSVAVRGFANFGILALGMPFALGIQLACYWLLGKVFFLAK